MISQKLLSYNSNQVLLIPEPHSSSPETVNGCDSSVSQGPPAALMSRDGASSLRLPDTRLVLSLCQGLEQPVRPRPPLGHQNPTWDMRSASCPLPVFVILGGDRE